MKNPHMVIAIRNMRVSLAVFAETLENASKWDDEYTDLREAKTLKHIKAAADKFSAELDKALKDM